MHDSGSSVSCSAGMYSSGGICRTDFRRVYLSVSAGNPDHHTGRTDGETLISQVLYDRDIGLPVQGMKDQEIKYLQVVKEDRATDRTPEKKER